MGLHRRYEKLLADNGIELSGGDDPLTGPQRERLEARFRRMMKTLFREEGAHLRLEIMGEDSVQDFITEHAAALDSAFENVEMSDTMRENLRHSDWMFSGLKTFHELKEAFPSLLDENGRRKPFERFLNDVQKVDETYNRHYLRAEYNFANASASMAGRWESFTDDNERFRLQYRTQDDGSVRPEHQALHGVTLPKDDPFWDSCYPPLGWNCRCTVVEVPAEDYPTTPRNEAENRAAEAMAKDKKGMFRFNSGKERRTFPTYNPYSIEKCRNCPKGKIGLAAQDNELCRACVFMQICDAKAEDIEKVGNGTIRISRMINHNDSDYDKLYQIARHFAENGAEVQLTPKMSRPEKFLYECYYKDLIGTKYEGKCPDLRINGVWYEHEGFTSDNPKNAFKNMLSHGLKQSDRLILDRPELTDRYMKINITARIVSGQKISEIWFRDDDGNINLFYKNTDG